MWAHMKLNMNRNIIYAVNKKSRYDILLSWAELKRWCGDNNFSLIINKTKELNVESGTQTWRAWNTHNCHRVHITEDLSWILKTIQNDHFHHFLFGHHYTSLTSCITSLYDNFSMNDHSTCGDNWKQSHCGRFLIFSVLFCGEMPEKILTFVNLLKNRMTILHLWSIQIFRSAMFHRAKPELFVLPHKTKCTALQQVTINYFSNRTVHNLSTGLKTHI